MLCTTKLPQKPQLCNRTQLKRYVEPFSAAAFFQPNIVVFPPHNLNIRQQQAVNWSFFRTLFLRGDIPCQQSFSNGKNNKQGTRLLWKVSPHDLDYCHYLPIFFDGLCEPKYPYNIISFYAIHDLLQVGGDKVLTVVPKLITPIRQAFKTKIPGVIVATLRALQLLCTSNPCVGRALVPHFRKFLPALNIFCNCNKNKLDNIDYDRVGRLGDIIDDTLKLLEQCGGPNAYINIKYSIPTYESCVNNCKFRA